MKAPHVLLILLVLVALGAHAYVTLEYDYRDAPQDIRLALGVGFLVTALLAILLGPRMLRGRGRGAIILPVLALVLLSPYAVTGQASDTVCGSKTFTYDPASRYLTGAGIQIVSRNYINIYLWLNPFYPSIGPNSPRVDGYVEWWMAAGNASYYTITDTLVVSLPGNILSEWREPGRQLYVKACIHWAPTVTGEINFTNTTLQTTDETMTISPGAIGLGAVLGLLLALVLSRHR